MEKGETIASSVSGKVSPNMEELQSGNSSCWIVNNNCRSSTAADGDGDGDAAAAAADHHHHHESYPSSDKVMSHDDHPGRPLLSTNGVEDGGGPTLNDSGANEVGRSSFPASSPRITSSSNIFCDNTSSSNARGGGSGTPTPTITTPVRTLQPFDISHTQTAFKSPGGGGGGGGRMAAALGFPFTVAQWRELERQAMIYKYMVASLPVPPDLLIPFTNRNFSDPSAPLGSGSLYSLRYQNRDPEPGRCKRTDGKKWRCSRDVAPHQKYCERHMHRGRPRSRKHVEVHPSVDTNNNKKTRLNQIPLQTNPSGQPNHGFSPLFSGTVGQTKDTLILGGTRASATTQNLTSPYKESKRMLGRMMQNGEMVAATNGVEQQWLHLMDPKRGLPAERQFCGTNGSILHHGFAEDQPLNLFSYTDLTQEDIRSHNEDCHMLLNSDLISLKQPQMDDFPISRDFIDAWSNGNLESINNNEPSISSSQGNLSPSSLNLSIAMAAGDVLDTQMGLSCVVHPPPAAVAETEHREPKYFPASWLPFSSGGPLAEVLHPSSNMGGGSNPASPYATNTDSTSPPATAVSSPSGVLQRAFFSQSDGSVCNSPTIAVSAAPQEVVPFQWFS